MVVVFRQVGKLTTVTLSCIVSDTTTERTHMQTTRNPSPSFFGVSSGLPDKMAVVLNQRELATIKKAVAIIEEVRDRMRADMGTPTFEESLWYVLDAHDLADEEGTIGWEVWK